MARRGSGWLASTLLLGVCIGLASIVYDQVRTAGPVPVPPGNGVETPAFSALPAQPSYAMAPVEDFLEILERPLFSPTRLPPVEGEVVAVVPKPKLKVTLVGVIISSTEQIAIVKLADGARFARLSLGDDFEGWILESIEPSSIIFRRGEVEEIIELTYDTPPPVQRPKRRKRRKRVQPGQETSEAQPAIRQE